MKHIKSLLWAAVVSGAFISCTEEFESSFKADKPDEVAYFEELNALDALKMQVDQSANPNFKMGTGVTISEFLNRGPLYSLSKAHFDEIVPMSEMNHGSTVNDDGTMTFNNLNGLFDLVKETELAIHGQSLVWHENQNSTYLNATIAPTIIPAPPAESGSTVIADFESDEVGTTYTMSNGGSGTVGNDPQGTGKALNIVGVQTHPNFTVTLPEGITLGNCTEVVLDFLGTGSTGMYGQGMRMAVNDGSLSNFDSPASFGASDNVWLRGLIRLPISNLNLTEEQKQLTSFTLVVGSATGSANYWIDNITVEWEVGGGSAGTVVMSDFDSDAAGATYEMTNGGSATVVTDPQGTSNVLNVVGAYTFPKFEVTLPPGVTLGNCTAVVLDFLGTGSTGMYGAGMRMGLNDGSLAEWGGPASFGASDNVWLRSGIRLPIDDLNITEDQRDLTSFTITVGSATGSGNYFIDNVVIEWEITGDQVINKTPEEKDEILTGELDKWIAGIMGVSKDYVKAWDVVSDPMDDANPSELKTGEGQEPADGVFYWQDYLGKDYAVKAFNLAAQYGNENDKLFISDNNLHSNVEKCNGLISFVEYIESQGARVDGISAQMPVSTSTDKAGITAMFELLAATGKLIKVSELEVSVSEATDEEFTAQAEMYKFVAQEYFRLIPAEQRYGITLRSPIDRADEPVGLWMTYERDHARKPAYAAFVEALSGKQ